MGICLHGLTGTPRQADAAVRCGSGRCPVPRSYWRPGLDAQAGVAAANVMPGPRRFPAANFSICRSMNRFLVMTAVFSRLLPGPALGSTLQVADPRNITRNLPGPWTLAAFRRTGDPLPRQPSPRYVTTLHHEGPLLVDGPLEVLGHFVAGDGQVASMAHTQCACFHRAHGPTEKHDSKKRRTRP